MPDFVCVNGWREVHRQIFLENPPLLGRYPVYHCARNPHFLLLWCLADTLSSSFFGKYCAFSIQHSSSLLNDAVATHCACMLGS